MALFNTSFIKLNICLATLLFSVVILILSSSSIAVFFIIAERSVIASSLFNSNLFIDETETNKQNVEMANITKEEYEILQAKINQLMTLLNKK